MITNNYRIWQAFVMSNTSLSNTVKALISPLSSMSPSGTVTTGWTHILASSSSFTSSYSALNTSNIFVGQGTTTPSPTDNGLTGVLPQGSSVSSVVTIGKSLVNNVMTMTIQAVITNITAADITINEIGWFKNLLLSNTAGTTSANTCYVMMAREVLATPVTLAPDETKTFKIQLSV